MERQIEQLLKEVKGNETLERLVKMNRNPNELFIERIRTMNKGEGNVNDNDTDIANKIKILAAINDKMSKLIKILKEKHDVNDSSKIEEEIITRSNNPKGYNEFVYEHYHDNDDEFTDLEELEDQDVYYIWDPTESDIKDKKVNYLVNPTGLSLIDLHSLLTQHSFDDDDSSDDEDEDN